MLFYTNIFQHIFPWKCISIVNVNYIDPTLISEIFISIDMPEYTASEIKFLKAFHYFYKVKLAYFVKVNDFF